MAYTWISMREDIVPTPHPYPYPSHLITDSNVLSTSHHVINVHHIVTRLTHSDHTISFHHTDNVYKGNHKPFFYPAVTSTWEYFYRKNQSVTSSSILT